MPRREFRGIECCWGPSASRWGLWGVGARMGGLLDSMAVLKMNVLRGCLFLGSLTWWMSVDAGFGNGQLGRLRFGELSRRFFF